MVTKIFDSLFLAINEVDLIFWQLIDGSGLMFVVIGVLFFALVYKFLLAPFFGGIVNAGVSDSVKRVTRTGRHSQGNKNNNSKRK